jgi:hypothetical protein
MQALSQLSYTPKILHYYWHHYTLLTLKSWRPQGDSNPCTHRERVMS